MQGRPIKKRALTHFVDAKLLDDDHRLRINISETLERRLRSRVTRHSSSATARKEAHEGGRRC